MSTLNLFIALKRFFFRHRLKYDCTKKHLYVLFYLPYSNNNTSKHLCFDSKKSVNIYDNSIHTYLTHSIKRYRSIQIPVNQRVFFDSHGWQWVLYRITIYTLCGWFDCLTGKHVRIVPEKQIHSIQSNGERKKRVG